jgi:hypothetical protein
LRKVVALAVAAWVGLVPVAFAADRPATSAAQSPVPNPRSPDGHGYTPADIASMYHLTGKRAGLVTIISFAEGLPAQVIDHDVSTYRAAFHLPSCTLASGCLQIHDLNPSNPTSPVAGQSTKEDQENALDLEAASAACPDCPLQLVRSGSGPTDSEPYIVQAVDAAITKYHARVLNLSFSGGFEYPSDVGFSKVFQHRKGVSFLVAGGDSGNGPLGFPATSPDVISVGGTKVTRKGARWVTQGWNGSASGCSKVFPIPAYQKALRIPKCHGRAVSDISALGDPDTGIAIFYQEQWRIAGGTSLAAPLMAAMIARAGSEGLTPADLYRDRSGILDVTTGRGNERCTSPTFCSGDLPPPENVIERDAHAPCDPSPRMCDPARGWDGETGLGTPYDLSAFAPSKLVHH